MRLGVRRLRFGAALGAALAVAALLPAASVASAGSRDPELVRTSGGTLRGAVTADGRYFGGIPYAAPPVGDLRWRMPQPAAPWRGVRSAVWPGPSCAQAPTSYGGGPGSATEDCLSLNVHTPPVRRRSGKPLPVMVWIHGGAFTSGSGAAYNGGILARTGNVVVVTINYRLGPFGWLVHPALDAEAGRGTSGNYGLADQQAALRWVRRNIAAFGGDPRAVTIFGESAGGASVCSQLASPAARGLFRAAIAQSGCTSLGRDTAAARESGVGVARSLGCTDAATAAACLRAVPADRLRSAAAGAGGGALPWAPVVDGRLLPLPVTEAFRTGRFARVPLLHGTNTDEGTFLVLAALGQLRLTEATYRFALDSRYGAHAARVAAAYPASAYPTPTNALAATITDSVFTCPALEADRILSRRIPVYAYEFADRDAPLLIPADFPQGAYHAAELQYVFQRTPVLNLEPAFTPAQRELSQSMSRYWATFATRGTPNTRTLPHWPRATSGNLLTLAPAATRPTPLTDVAAAHHCDLWTTIPS